MLAIRIIQAVIFVAEALALIASAIFGFAAVFNRDGTYGALFGVTGLIFVATEMYRRYGGKLFKTEGSSRTPAERIQHREELRKKFEEEIYRCRREKLREDVIIRHVNRVDNYPNVDNKSKGISPWFRAFLLDTYHKGIRVGLRIESLTKDSSGLRHTNHKEGESSDIDAILIGEIPYDFIEAVNIVGDEYYYYPHIYCHFAYKGEPYERLIYCEKRDMGNGHPYYKEVATYEEVKRNSKGITR